MVIVLHIIKLSIDNSRLIVDSYSGMLVMFFHLSLWVMSLKVIFPLRVVGIYLMVIYPLTVVGY